VAIPNLTKNDPELWEVGNLLGLNEGVPKPEGMEEPIVKNKNVEEEGDGSDKNNNNDNNNNNEAATKREELAAAAAAAPPPTLPASEPEVKSPKLGRGNGALSSSRGSVGRGGRMSSSGSLMSTRGRGGSPAGTPGSVRKALPVPGEKATSPREKVISPRDKALPSPQVSARGSASLKKPTSQAPRPPSKAAPLSPKAKSDPLDPNLNYSELEDDQLPSLPQEAPAMDDMLRWQQYQRLKTEYRDRELEVRYE
jgi:hypothetical protein